MSHCHNLEFRKARYNNEPQSHEERKVFPAFLRVLSNSAFCFCHFFSISHPTA